MRQSSQNWLSLGSGIDTQEGCNTAQASRVYEVNTERVSRKIKAIKGIKQEACQRHLDPNEVPCGDGCFSHPSAQLGCRKTRTLTATPIARGLHMAISTSLRASNPIEPRSSVKAMLSAADSRCNAASWAIRSSTHNVGARSACRANWCNGLDRAAGSFS